MKDMGMGGGDARLRSLRTDELYAPFSYMLPMLGPGDVWFVDGSRGASGDGTSWDDAFKTIQEAVDASGDGTGDSIFVAPYKYTENVLVKDHEGLLIAAVVPGWPTRIRASDATTKITYTSLSGQSVQGVCFAVLSRGVTIDGFCLDGGGNYAGAYIGDGYRIDSGYNENAASSRITNCLFLGGGEGEEGLTLDGCSDSVIVENNIFSRWDTAAIYISAGGTRTVQRPIIRNNHFISGASAYGIDMYSHATTVGVQIIGNTFADYVSEAFTQAIRCQGAGVHAIHKNTFACTNKIDASSTDFCSGNFTSSAGNSAAYVEEE